MAAALAFPLLLALSAAAPRLHVASSTLGAELSPLLQAELGPLARTASAAELEVRLSEDTAGIGVVLQPAGGPPLFQRTFATEHGRGPALRAVVVSIAEVLRSRAETATVSAPVSAAAPVPSPAPPRLSLRAGPGLRFEGGAPQLAVQLAGRLALGRLALVLGAGYSGLACCTMQNAGGELSGEARVWSVALGLEAPLLSLGPVELGAEASLGLASLSLQADPVVFVGDTRPQQVEGRSAVARVGAGLSGPLSGRLGWRASAGLELRSSRLEVELPAGFPMTAEALRSDRAHPYAELSLELGLF